MEHKTFRILTLLSILCIIGATIGFNLVENDKIKLVLKIFPVSILIALSFFYIIHYKFTYYAFLTSLVLFFCLLGDIFMSLFEPSIAGQMSDKDFYLIMGGASFLTARIILIFVFALNTEKNKHSTETIISPRKVLNSSSNRFIKYKRLVFWISHICFNLPFVALGIIFLIFFKYSEISIFVLIYFILGFGTQLSYAFLRINAIPEESIVASIFGFVGMFCFNVSDVFLLTTLLTNLLPNYTIIISNYIYWLAMILITISIVRYSETSVEKEIELKGLRYM